MQEELTGHPAQSMAGSMIAGRYRVIRPLRGGPGQESLAEESATGQSVVVTVAELEGKPSAEVLREAHQARSLSSQYIAPLLDFGVDQATGGMFFVRQAMQGDSLAEILGREGRLPWRRGVTLIRQLATGLSAAHGCGLLHRELSPASCLVLRPGSPEETVQLLHLGLPKATDSTRTLPGDARTRAVSGSSEYLTPEHARGQPLDARADVYSLAVLLYRLVVGRVPFSGTNFMRVLVRHMTERPERPSVAAPDAGIPTAVDALILRALETDPNDRFQTMAAFERALAAALGEATPEPVPLDASWNRVGSHPTPRQEPQTSADFVEPTVMLDKPFADRNVPGTAPSRTVIFEGSDASPSAPAEVPEPTMLLENGGLRSGESSPEHMAIAKDTPLFRNPPPNIGSGPSVSPPDPLDFADAFDEPQPRRWVVPAIIGGAILAVGGGILVAKLLVGDAGPTAQEEVPVIGGPTAAAVPPSQSPALPTPPPSPPMVAPATPPAPAAIAPVPPVPSIQPPAPEDPRPRARPSRSDRGNSRAGLPETLSITQLEHGLRAARRAVKVCAKETQTLPGMKVTAEFVVAGPTGKVIEAKALKPHQQTPVGRCVVRVLKTKVRFSRSRESRFEQSEEFVF